MYLQKSILSRYVFPMLQNTISSLVSLDSSIMYNVCRSCTLYGLHAHNLQCSAVAHYDYYRIMFAGCCGNCSFLFTEYQSSNIRMIETSTTHPHTRCEFSQLPAGLHMGSTGSNSGPTDSDISLLTAFSWANWKRWSTCKQRNKKIRKLKWSFRGQK